MNNLNLETIRQFKFAHIDCLRLENTTIENSLRLYEHGHITQSQALYLIILALHSEIKHKNAQITQLLTESSVHYSISVPPNAVEQLIEHFQNIGVRHE